MKKFKRILSAILIAAMALSLMPTFASAAVGDTYTYVFNPNQDDETVFSSTAFTWENTVSSAVTGITPWEYISGYGFATNMPQTQNWGDGKAKDVLLKDKNGDTYYYAAFKLQIPETGVYSSKMTYTAYKLSGSVELYLLPGNIELKFDGTDDFNSYSAYKLTDDAVSLNTSLFNTETTKYACEHSLTKSVTISSENEVGNDGAGRVFVIRSTVKPTGSRSNDYVTSLTLTKTAEAEDDGEVTPPEEDEEAPITLTFNNETVDTGDNQKSMNALKTASTNTDFTIVAYKTMGTAAGNQYTRSNAVNLNFRYSSKSAKNWLYFLKNTEEVEDNNAGKFTVQANNIPAGTYKVDFNVTNNDRGAGVYLYVDENYVGYCDTYKNDRSWNANPSDTDTKEIGYITVVDEDSDAETTNTVEIAICSASIDASSTTSNYLTLKSITFTPVDEIPDYGDLTYEVTGATAAGDGYTVENNTTLSLSAMLSGKHLNGYTLDGTKDNNNYIKVSSSDESIVSVTDTNAALDSEAIYASGYKPVYTLTAHKSNASATITVEAIVDGDCVAEKTFTVSVAKSDTDEYNSEATFAWGTTLPDSLKDKVTVTEKDGASVSAGEITASKGTTYVLSAEPEISDGDTTYKFIGWKRGATGSGAVAFIGYEVEDEYTVWSNTYITAVYDEIKETDEKTVEFYDQDGFYLGAMTESQLETNGLPTNNPKLLGHTFSKWQYVDNGVTKEFTATTELTEKVTRVVALQTPAKVAITYKNENDGIVAEKTYDYDQEVNALGDSNLSDVKYWKLLVGNSEKTVRTSNGYNFYAWENATIKAYTVDVEATDKSPKVVLHGTPRDDSYMIEYDRYSSSYTIVEAGILLGGTETISILSCDKKYTSAKGGRAHGQFAAPHENYDYVRGYIIYKTNSTGALSVVYTDTMPTEK